MTCLDGDRPSLVAFPSCRVGEGGRPIESAEMARKLGQPTSIRLHAWMRDALKAEADQRRWALSVLIEDVLRKWIFERKPELEELDKEQGAGQ